MMLSQRRRILMSGLSKWIPLTLSGTSLTFETTKEGYFDALQIDGKSVQSSVPTISVPVGITSLANYNLKSNLTEIPITQSMNGIDEYKDYISVSDGEVLYVQKIKVIPITSSNVNNFAAYTSGNAWEGNHMCVFWNGVSPLMVGDLGLNNYMTIVPIAQLQYPYLYGITENFSILSNRITISLRRESIGVSSEATQAECVTAIKNWLIGRYNAGNPLTFYVALETPITTDITSTTLGQALLSVPTYAPQTILTTDSTLTPTLTATCLVKE